MENENKKSKLTAKDIDELSKRAARGEKITF